MQRFLFGIVAFFYLFSLPVMAIEKLPSVFYPLPTQTQGKVYAAQNLFLGGEGGIWIHDIHGKVRFFDGHNVLPNQGSILNQNYQHLTYLNNAFWVFVDGALHRTSSTKSIQKVVDLPLGVVIDKIGVSGSSVWLASKEHFFTYDSESELLESYSLEALSHFDSKRRVIINDARFGISKWVLATSSGVFLSEDNGFEHIPRSGNDYVETLFFSEKRREMLIGTLNGVLIIDLKNKKNAPKRVAKSHVLSMAETENEYWIGTENGLFVHSLLNDVTTKLKSSVHSEYSLQGQKIFSLVNDLQGGIWIASEKGVFYYSMFGQKFNRFLPKQITPNTFSSDIRELQSVDSNAYMVTTSEGVYQLSLSQQLKKEELLKRQVNDSAFVDKQLWLATNDGLAKFDISRASFDPVKLPIMLSHGKIDQLEVVADGTLWGVSGNKLWSFNAYTNHFVDYGEDWIVDVYLPATVTQLVATKSNGIIIGTEHGTYTVLSQKVVFDIQSHEYGQTHSILEDSELNVWFAADYGIYKLDSNGKTYQSVPLAEDSISPKCLVETPQGIWASSSRGLTLYSLKGDVKKHFGEPYGLINNEFLPGICTSNDDSDYPQIVIGSTQGLVRVSAEELSVSRLPSSPTIVSQIKIDDELLSVGSQVEFSFDYGRVLRLVFGSLPQTVNSSLEYRINDSSLWQTVDGSQLTLDHLRPGKYRLYLRNTNSKQINGTETYLAFRVIEPWYMTTIALSTFVLLVVCLLAFFIWWRSRLMARANKILKEQVNLKTSQLRHQSKVVLSNNLQLRKQIQVRHALLENMLTTIEPRLEKLTIDARKAKLSKLESLALEARRDLEQVKNIRSDNVSNRLVHDISLVLESAVSSWMHEFQLAGIKIELDIPPTKNYVELTQFNLDVIFNTLLSEAIKRLYKAQTLYVKCYPLDQRMLVLMSDQGVCAQNVTQVTATTSGFELHQLKDLVEHSGGVINVFVSKEQNVVQLSWPCADLAQVLSGIESYTKYTEEPIVEESECGWFTNVDQLVNEHYSDPEFSTATVIKAIYMSERSFQRRFKSVTGKTFKEYLNQVRLEKACQHLLSGEKISQVAYDCGFNDPSYFSQRFKNYFGLSPTQFVEEHQQ